MAHIVRYFQDVRRGFSDYLNKNPGAPRYHVGIYGTGDVLTTLYRAGLATHFWQLPWGTWTAGVDPGSRPFPHLNAWQVAIEDDAKNSNPSAWGCGVAADIVVSWGDPGCFQADPPAKGP
jgi:hypothetical protein